MSKQFEKIKMGLLEAIEHAKAYRANEALLQQRKQTSKNAKSSCLNAAMTTKQHAAKREGSSHEG